MQELQKKYARRGIYIYVFYMQSKTYIIIHVQVKAFTDAK